MYLIRHYFPEYMKNSYNSVTTKSNLLKNGQNLEQTFTQRRYVKAPVESAQMNIKFINKYMVLYLCYSNSRGMSRSKKSC